MDLLLVLFILIVFAVFFPLNENFSTSGYSRVWSPYPHSKPAGYPTAMEPWTMTKRQRQQGDGLPDPNYI